jgi:hypothetical protein
VAQQKVQLPANSAYVTTPIYQQPDGTVVFGLLQLATPPDPSDRLYTVPAQFEDRLDLISNGMYGLPDFWWAIAEANGLVDPLMEASEGVQIRIPLKSRLPST